jgi:NADP-dependent 3-hydroxy acid dehydrogenase YdfG
MPGSTAKMDPRPDHGETSYKGSGKLTGKKALITGGDSGIGRAVAIAYAREGADILIAYLDEDDDAQEVKALIEKEGRKAVLVAGDLRSPEHCRSVVKRAVEELGGIDILVNNAAHQATFKDIGDISDEEWQMTFEVNIHSMFYLTKAAVPHMKPGSAVINTASVNSDMPNPILLAYATTKGAIQNFTGGLAQLLAQKHSRERRGAGTDLDTLDPVDDARGCREEFWRTGPVAAGRATGGTSNGVCHAGRSTLKLHIRNYCCGHRWQAVHLGGDLSGNLTANPNGTFCQIV